nr:TolC family protein [Malikia spinosa]
MQAPAGQAVDGQLASLEAWLALAQQHNPLLRLQQAQVEVAAAEVRKHGLAGSATVDLVAQASRERLGGSGDYGTASNSQSQQMVGVALNLPLYTGGWRSAKLAEALSLEQKARAELERARLQLAQQTRASWLALNSGQARLAALEQALLASRARLDATRLGRQVGDRTTLDLLNAENDAAAAELALLQARTELLQNRLRLQALAGQLDLPGLQAVNAKLQP